MGGRTNMDKPVKAPVVPIDIIIPVYNREGWLAQSLSSVVAQTYPHWELFIVDDGSTDGTQQICAQWAARDPRIQWVSQARSGVSAARNRGVAMGQAPWVAFLDSDDQWKPEKLKRQVQQILESPDLRFFHCDEIWIRNGVRVNPHKKHKKSGGQLFLKSLPLCCISPSAALIHRGLFEELGGFREDFTVCEDYDLWLKVTERDEVGFLDEALVVKQGGHSDQLSRQMHSMDHYRCWSLMNTLERGRITEEQRQAVIKILLKKLSVLMGGARKHQNLARYDCWFDWQQKALGLRLVKEQRIGIGFGLGI